MRAAEEKEIRHNIEAQGLMSYNEKLLEEYRNSSADEDIVSEISCYSLILLRSVFFQMLYGLSTQYTCRTCYDFNVLNVSQLSQQVDDVRISCDQNLTVKSEQIDATMQWNFRVETEVRFYNKTWSWLIFPMTDAQNSRC